MRVPLLARHRAVPLLLVALCTALYLPGIAARDLWRPDEVRYTEVAREMEASGDFILLRLNDTPYPDKPPLFFWLVLLFKKLLGSWSPVPARMVSGSAALGVMLLTFLMAKRLGMGHAGLAAAVVLATAAEFLWMARWGAMDTIFSFFIALSLYAFLLHRQRPSRAWLTAAYLSVSMAILAKGPLGAVIPALAAGLTVGLLAGPRAVMSKSLLWGTPLVIVPVLLWLIPDIILAGGWEHGRQVLFSQNLGRITDPQAHHQHFTYYLTNFPLNFLPWTLFLPGALVLLARDRSLPRETRVFLAVWFAGVFLFLTLLPPKREKYLLPLYPAAALIVGHLLSGAETRRYLDARWLTMPARAFCWLVVAAGLGFTIMAFWGLPIAGGFAPDAKEEIAAVLAPFSSRLALLLAGAGTVAAAGLALRRIRHGPGKTSLALAAVLSILIATVAGCVLLPRADAFKSARQLSDTLVQKIGPDTPLGLYRNLYQGAFNFYLGRSRIPVLKNPAQLAGFLSSPGNPAVLARERDLKAIPAQDRFAYDVLLKGKIEGQRILVIALPRGRRAEFDKMPAPTQDDAFPRPQAVPGATQ